jgi:adenylate cyclase
VLNGEVDPAGIRGKIVLIGASAPGLMDLRATPLGAAIPGVEIHQQVLEQLLSGRFLTRPDLAPALELLTAIFAVLLLAITSPRLSAGAGAALGAATILAIFGASALAFLRGGYLFDPVFPSACAFLFGAGSAVYLHRQTEMQRAEIRRAFSQYVSPSVVRQLAANPERLRLGGEVRDLTLLFCDVRNFTGISEGMAAEELTSFINRLLTPLTDIIIETGGTVDKYMGDAIMAFWNAPLDDPGHARHACEAAAQMVAKMTELNAEWRAEAEAAGRSYTEVAIGIGVNSGDCCVGNLGSYRRFDYSAIGDNVNLTSRLEGLTKVYGLPLVVGEDTAGRLPDLHFLEVDLVRVKGRTTPTRIFTLPSTLRAEAAALDVVWRLHEGFLRDYRNGDWTPARASLAELQANGPESLRGLYATYGQRIAKLAERGGETWDGVYELEEK